MTEPFSTILLTGITGTFGTAMTRFLLENTAATIRGISRDEYKQAVARRAVASHRVRYFLGDVRDVDRLRIALRGVDCVYHAAALKQIDAGEVDPQEFIATNVDGTRNVIAAAIDSGVKRAIFISSDKATSPVNVYGTSKALAEKLWIRANGYAPHGTEFVALRYGNVAGSRGSVIPLWQECLRHETPLPVTDLSMSRFYLSTHEAVAVAAFAATTAPRGSIMVPHLPAFTMADLVQALCEEAGIPRVALEHIGVRPGEKFHEELLTDEESTRIVQYVTDGPDTPLYYCVTPVNPTWPMLPLAQWSRGKSGDGWLQKPLAQRYESGTWPYRLGVTELRERLREL